MKHSIESRVENFKKYYKKQNDRPLLGFFLGSEYPLHRYPNAAKLPESHPLSPDDFKLEPFIRDSQMLFKMHEDCGGDFIWSASAFWAIPWVEAALGCPIVANHSTGSIHAEKPAGLELPADLPNFDPQTNKWLQKMEKYLSAVTKASEGKWPIATTRMRGISDLLAQFLGGDSFMFTMMENPELVHKCSEKFTDFWIKMAKFQVERIPEFHGGIGSFYYNNWAPKGTVWHQEDASALLSPKLFEEFIKPYDKQIVDSLQGCIMHMHPGGFTPIEEMIDIGIDAIELHVDQGGKKARELNHLHLQILKDKPLLIWGQLSDDDLNYIFSELPYEGLAINVMVDSPDKAQQIWNRYMKQYNV